jgi:hypothetical protein
VHEKTQADDADFTARFADIVALVNSNGAVNLNVLFVGCVKADDIFAAASRLSPSHA